ncbi:MAG: 16S rRNA (cytosine(1402)-N(4))-methyltransferase RsmH, partial [Patescibacteria group bacterium]
LREYGEEKFSRHIAEKICQERELRPIKKTFELVELIKKSIPVKLQRGRIHFATKSFQALRIAVNKELDNLKEFLPQALEILPENGRLAVISFHSLEDRIVKNFFKERRHFIKLLSKKPIIAGFDEVASNPRARSAKLRVAEKLI